MAIRLEFLIQIHAWNSRTESGFCISFTGWRMTRIAAGSHLCNAHPCRAQLLYSVFIHPRADPFALAIRQHGVQVDNANLSLRITRDRIKRVDLSSSPIDNSTWAICILSSWTVFTNPDKKSWSRELISTVIAICGVCLKLRILLMS